MEEQKEKRSKIKGLRGLCSFTIGEPEGKTDKVFEEKKMTKLITYVTLNKWQIRQVTAVINSVRAWSKYIAIKCQMSNTKMEF